MLSVTDKAREKLDELLQRSGQKEAYFRLYVNGMG